MEARVATALGCVLVDLESGDAGLVDDEPPAAWVAVSGHVSWPPVLLSDDAGQTWREAGGGLPRGTAITIHADDPDLLLFASESRLFLSEDGGRFWRSLPPELIGITALAFS